MIAWISRVSNSIRSRAGPTRAVRKRPPVRSSENSRSIRIRPLLPSLRQSSGSRAASRSAAPRDCWITGWDQPACLPGKDQFLGSFHGRGDDGPAGGHGLENDVRHPLPERSQHQQVGRPEQAGNIIASSQPVNPAVENGPSRKLFQQPVPTRAVSGQGQVPVRDPGK